MALRSNQTEQMAKRLKQDIQLLAPAAAVELKEVNGAPCVEVKEGGVVTALIALRRRTFQGYNIVAELSPSAGEGFPEHQCVVAIRNNTAPAKVALIAKAAFSAQASEMAIIETSAAPVDADLSAAATAVIPNDARLGSVGL